MKSTWFLFTFSLLLTHGFGQNSTQQQEGRLPQINLKNINGETKQLSQCISDKGLTLLCFWKTCCTTNTGFLAELFDAIEESGMDIKVVTIAVDDTRSSCNVKPYVQAKAWECVTLLDPNSDLKRAMNVINPPHIFIIGKEHNILYEQKISSPSEATLIISEAKKIVEMKK